MSHIYEHFCAGKSFWTDLWPIGAAAWLTLRGPPSTLDTQAIGLAIFSFYLIHFSLRVQFCLVPYFFKSPEFWFLEDWKKNNFFFRVESWRSRPIRSTEDVTRWNRSNHFLNFFLKKSNFLGIISLLFIYFIFLIIKMNLTFCIILSLRPRELEMCHRNKPRIKYSRSTKMFSPNFQNWSFSKNYFYVIKI